MHATNKALFELDKAYVFTSRPAYAIDKGSQTVIRFTDCDKVHGLMTCPWWRLKLHEAQTFLDPAPSRLRLLEQRAEWVPSANHQACFAIRRLQLLYSFQPFCSFLRLSVHASTKLQIPET
ncbi:hypothetical protein H5410_005599 [Solanum commersonii]|uniref:Late blight resistance protein n=1 Tax=Solanum commersonii TaxID=4109 RepID=A0A9J6A716_SOLCO|nr:hypothetical protein H5410_005599 [Solanum commersonii]